ncbi:hypothetical protein [Candidatus Nitrospira bockiana]
MKPLGGRIRAASAFLLSALLATGFALAADLAHAGAVGVHFPEGVTQGFLVIRSLDGRTLGQGELRQTAAGKDRLVSRLVFHFHDGSLHDETVVFSQEKVFRLLRYSLVQEGPSFPSSLSISIDRETGEYRVRSRRPDAVRETVLAGTLSLPEDVYNGMTVTVLKNLSRSPTGSIHMLAFMPEPQLYEVSIEAAEKEPVRAGRVEKRARHYVLTPKLGGFIRFFARLLGKSPPTYHVWILADDIPAFVRFEGPLGADGPTWRIEVQPPALPDSDGHEGRKG